MEIKETYKDSFSTQFTRESEFLDFLGRREGQSHWATQKANTLQFVALEEGSAITDLLRDNYTMAGMVEILKDTLDNTRLMLRHAEQYTPVRSCAIKSILDRARVSGKSLSKIRKEEMAHILNVCMGTATGDALIRVSDGKVSAVLGGDNSDYAVLQMDSLFGRTAVYLQGRFKQCIFGGANYDHAITTALWALEDSEDLTAAYEKALAAHGCHGRTVQAALRLTSSDVGFSGANLHPMLVTGDKVLPLGHALSLEHKHGATLNQFDDLLQMTFSQYAVALEGLTALLDIEVQHPINALLGVMKKIGITKKLAYEVAALYKAQYGEGETTAHNLYYAIADAPDLMQTDGATATRITSMEENAARALLIRWADYDMPGDFNW